MTDDLEDRLSRILGYHLSEFQNKRRELGKPLVDVREKVFREIIVEAFLHGRNEFRFSSRKNDLESINEAARHLEAFWESLEKLSGPSSLVLIELGEKRYRRGKSGPKCVFDNYEFVKRDVEILRRLLRIRATDKRIDWQAAAVAGCVAGLWEMVTKTTPPKYIHADAPGPFGRFLQDILDELYSSMVPAKKIPSARSAMRALQNVTNSGGILMNKW